MDVNYLARDALMPEVQPSDEPVNNIPTFEECAGLVRALKNGRTDYEKRWKEIRDTQLPFLGEFDDTADSTNPARRRDLKIVTPVAWLSCQAFGAGVMSGLTPPSRQWFKLTFSNAGLSGDHDAAMILDMRQEIMESVLHRSNFYNSIHSCYMELPFGQAPLAVFASDTTGVRFQAYTVGTYYLGISASGRVNTFARKFKMTPFQLAEQFGLDAVPDAVKDMLRNPTSKHGKKLDVWWLVIPNENHKDKPGRQNMPYLSLYWLDGINDKKFIHVGGFEEFPVPVARYQVSDGEAYGKGAGWYAEGDSKALQIMKKDVLTWVELSVKPPMKAPPDVASFGINLIPGGVTQVNELNGQNQVTPVFNVGSNPQWLAQQIVETENTIKRTYSADLFLMLDQLDNSNMTAREVMERQQEKLQQLGPVVERLQDEFLTPILERVYNILDREGVFPPVPDEMAERLAQEDVKVVYLSPLAQAQKMSGLVNIEQALSFTAQLAQLYPEVLKQVDPFGTIRKYFDLLGAPAVMQKSAEEVQAILAQEQQAAQEQQEMAMQAQATQQAQAEAQVQAQQMQNAQVSAQTARVLTDAAADGNPALQQVLGINQGGGVV